MTRARTGSPAECQGARTRKTDDEWLLPTLLAMAFDSGDVEKARELADEVESEGPSAWKLETTIRDLELAVGLHDAERAGELGRIVMRLKNLL